jgi:hypothetical protein
VFDVSPIHHLADAASHLCVAHDELVAAGFEGLALQLVAPLAAIDVELTDLENETGEAFSIQQS